MLFIFAAVRFWYNNIWSGWTMKIHPNHVWADEVTESCSPPFLQLKFSNKHPQKKKTEKNNHLKMYLLYRWFSAVMLVFRQVNLGEIFFCFTNFTKTFDLKSGVDKTGFCLRFWTDFALPKGSMYGIFTYTWLKFMVNVGKYTVYGSCGLETTPKRHLLSFRPKVCKYEL